MDYKITHLAPEKALGKIDTDFNSIETVHAELLIAFKISRRFCRRSSHSGKCGRGTGSIEALAGSFIGTTYGFAAIVSKWLRIHRRCRCSLRS
jgi:hypothetical protein